VVWKASVTLGFSATTGNSNVISMSGGANISRDDGKNRVALVVDGVYGFSSVLAYSNPAAMMNMLVQSPSDVTSQQTTTAAFLNAKLRYDRFFTPNNSGYIAVLSGFDLPASLQAKAEGQIGYARQLVKSPMHQLSGEIGYDFSYNRLIPPAMPPSTFETDVYIHSARLFLGYLLTVSTHSTLRASVEALINLNGVFIGDREVDPALATRVNGKFEFTTKIWKPLSFRAAFTARFNNAPALNAVLNYAETVQTDQVRYNVPLDTLTELGLLLQFL
jgi:hypothetical protein